MDKYIEEGTPPESQGASAKRRDRHDSLEGGDAKARKVEDPVEEGAASVAATNAESSATTPAATASSTTPAVAASSSMPAVASSGAAAISAMARAMVSESSADALSVRAQIRMPDAAVRWSLSMWSPQAWQGKQEETSHCDRISWDLFSSDRKSSVALVEGVCELLGSIGHDRVIYAGATASPLRRFHRLREEGPDKKAHYPRWAAMSALGVGTTAKMGSAERQVIEAFKGVTVYGGRRMLANGADGGGGINKSDMGSLTFFYVCHSQSPSDCRCHDCRLGRALAYGPDSSDDKQACAPAASSSAAAAPVHKMPRRRR